MISGLFELWFVNKEDEIRWRDPRRAKLSSNPN